MATDLIVNGEASKHKQPNFKMEPARSLDDAAWLSRAEGLLTHISYSQPEIQDIRELFWLHNDRLAPRETGMSCSSCATRVRLKVQNEINKLKGLPPEPPQQSWHGKWRGKQH